MRLSRGGIFLGHNANYGEGKRSSADSGILLAYNKCNGKEFRAKQGQSKMRRLLICRKFRVLGIPISSQAEFACAALTSLRVGALSTCIT
jgi:hypothetical protein